jgi:hypothetical protein
MAPITRRAAALGILASARQHLQCEPSRSANGSDSEKLAMSTMGPLCPEQQTQEETLDEVCVGRIADMTGNYADDALNRSTGRAFAGGI